MAKTFAYIEQCRDLHADIERSGIDLDVKEPSGWGSNTIYRSIGHSTLTSGEVVYIGQKSPRNYQMAINRLMLELTTICLITDRCPELMPLMPKFMGWTEWGDEPSNIVDDASRGGEIQVFSSSTSNDTRARLLEGFAEFGAPSTIFDDEELDRTTSFEAGKAERLLDFTPSPIRLSARDRIIKQAYPATKLLHFLDIANNLKFSLQEQE